MTRSTPCTIGLWIELSAAALDDARGDPRIRLARGLIIGLDAIPAVDAIVVPCLPSAQAAMADVFADAARPGRLISDKLRVVPTGLDRVLGAALAAWVAGRGRRRRDQLAAMGATESPSSWPTSLRRLADEQPRRPFAVLKRLLRLTRVSLGAWLAEAILAALRRLPSPHASMVADLRRRGGPAAWIVPLWDAMSGLRPPGRMIFDCGVAAAPNGRQTVRRDTVIRRFARAADAVAAPSRHAAGIVAGITSGGSGPRTSVIPPAPSRAFDDAPDEVDSRRRLARELRELFASDAAAAHRHFCDFPFERVEYLVAAPPFDADILPAYVAIMRRHRRNLKLIVDGRLPTGDGPVADVHVLGLTFDVVEAAGLGEAARARLLRHAQGVIVAARDAAVLPPVFAEAVGNGAPVVMGRMAAAQELLRADELATAEYFDVDSDAKERLVHAILHVLDHRDAVLARQRAILTRLRQRTWAEVTADYLALLPSS